MKWKNLKQYYLLSALLLLAFFGFCGNVLADQGQLDSSSSFQSSSFEINLGLISATSTLSTTTIAMSSVSHGSYGAGNHLAFNCYSDSGYTNYVSGCSYTKNWTMPNGISKTFWDFNTQDVILFNGYYYKLYEYTSNNWTPGSTNPEQYYYGNSGGNAYYNITVQGTGGGTSTSTSQFTNITVSTSTQTVTVTGYWNYTDNPNINELVEFYQNSDLLLGIESYQTISATSTGNFSLTFPFLLLPSASSTGGLTSDITFTANLISVNSNFYNPFGEYNPLYQTTLDTISTVLSSNQAQASTTGYFIGTSTRLLIQYPEATCDITHIGGCIKNVVIWAFYPTPGSIEEFYSLRDKLQQKAPFGYFYTLKNNISGLSATSTPAFSITIPSSLKTYIFNPFDIAIATILWIFFIFNFYKRFKQVQI